MWHRLKCEFLRNWMLYTSLGPPFLVAAFFLAIILI